MTLFLLCIYVSGEWTMVVGYWRITAWSRFQVKPQSPTGPVASDWPRRTEKTGKHQTWSFDFTCSHPVLSDQVLQMALLSLSAASVSVPDAPPSLHEYWERASKGEQTEQETSEEDSKVMRPLYFLLHHFLLLKWFYTQNLERLLLIVSRAAWIQLLLLCTSVVTSIHSRKNIIHNLPKYCSILCFCV